MPHLAGISLYPIKSLDPITVSEATVLPSGALRHDREFAIFDADGKVVNGKRTPKIHGLRSSFDLDTGALCLEARDTGRARAFRLPDDMVALDAWLSDYFGLAVTLRHDTEGGFPDDKNAPGPTVISTATLATIASWFPGLSVDSTRVRFRANLEIGGVPPFWEDRLYGGSDTGQPFGIGDVQFEGTNPCQRCVVPPRHPETGEAIADFSPIFRAQREETLPPWAERSRFNHFYRLAVNTRVPASEAGKLLRVGDEIRLPPLDVPVL